MVENCRGKWQGIFLHNRTLNSRLNEMDFSQYIAKMMGNRPIVEY